MEQKKRKPTNAELTRRIEKSPLHLDKTKSTQTIFFSDKGLRLTVDTGEGYALVETGFHSHVFRSYTSFGLSRPFLYTERVLKMAEENNCKTKDGYSYAKLLEVLKKKEDQSEYNIATYYSWYIHNIFSPLYTIGETKFESFSVYIDYVYNISKQSILLGEKNEDLTNKQFIEKVISMMRELTAEMSEDVILQKKTDEEIVQENIQAMQEEELDETEITDNGSKD